MSEEGVVVVSVVEVEEVCFFLEISLDMRAAKSMVGVGVVRYQREIGLKYRMPFWQIRVWPEKESGSVLLLLLSCSCLVVSNGMMLAVVEKFGFGRFIEACR